MCREILQLGFSEACSRLGFRDMWSKDAGPAGAEAHGVRLSDQTLALQYLCVHAHSCVWVHTHVS